MCAETARPSQDATVPEEAIRRANQHFFAAFESLDIAKMVAVWADDESVECVQPGWDLLLGWEEIRERWPESSRAPRAFALR
jgi:hypothetical protein